MISEVKWSSSYLGQTFWSISSQAGLQLLNVLVVLTCLKVHSTTTQTTRECEERSVTDTVALRLLYSDREMRTHVV